MARESIYDQKGRFVGWLVGPEQDDKAQPVNTCATMEAGKPGPADVDPEVAGLIKRHDALQRDYQQMNEMHEADRSAWIDLHRGRMRMLMERHEAQIERLNERIAQQHASAEELLKEHRELQGKFERQRETILNIRDIERSRPAEPPKPVCVDPANSADVQQLQAEIKRLRYSICEAGRSASNVIQERDIAQAQVDRLTESCDRLEAERNKYRDEVQRMTREQLEASQQAKDGTDSDQLKRELQRLTDENYALQRRVKELEARRKPKDQVFEDWQEELKKAQEKADRAIQEYKAAKDAEVAKINDEKDDAIANIEAQAYAKAMEEVDKEHESLKAQVKKELADLKSDSALTINNLKLKMAEREKELIEEVKRVQGLAEQLRQENGNASLMIEAVNNVNTDLKENVRQLRGMVTTLRKRIGLAPIKWTR